MKVRMTARFLVFAASLVGCASSSSIVRSDRIVSVEEDSPLEGDWNEAFLARSQETYQRVADLFAAHVARHEDDRAALNRYGKLLYAQGQWRAAAQAFEAAVGTDHVGQGAARNAILAWRRVLDQGDAIDAFAPLSDEEDVDREALTFLWDDIHFEDLSGRLQERNLSEVEQRLADAADRYVALADPTDEALPIIQLISANSYYRHYRFGEAADRCLRIVERWTRAEMALTCGNVIIHMFSQSEDNAQLEHYARALWTNRAALQVHPELRNTVEETLYFVAFQNVWRMVEEASKKRGGEKKQLLLEAAARFKKYQDEFPESPHADKALLNALAQYVTFDVRDDARAIAVRIVEDYPTSPVASQARQVLSQLDR
jgi:tetratricopeptide (TPR) repeat protein